MNPIAFESFGGKQGALRFLGAPWGGMHCGRGYASFRLAFASATIRAMTCHRKLALDVMNRNAEEAFGNMPAASVERYRIYLATGAAFNALMRWLLSGVKESPRDLAQACVRMLDC